MILNFDREESVAPRVTETRDSQAGSIKERRVIEVKNLRVVRDAGKPPKIVGHAAVFNKLSLPLKLKNGTQFREKIAPGAFKRSISTSENPNTDIAALVGHDKNKLLARSSAGTLTLAEDADGLAVEVTPPATTLANDTMADIEHGNIRGMSFGFGDAKDTWERIDGENIRTLLDVDLGEVTFTPWPAYPDTDVNVRAIEAGIAKLENRAIVQVEDNSIQYISDWVLRSCQETFQTIRCLIRTVNGLGENATLTDADQAALSDAMDQVLDLEAKIGCLKDCTDGLYEPLNSTDDDDRDDTGAGANSQPIGDYSDAGGGEDDDDEDGDDSESRERLYRMIQTKSEAGGDTLQLRQQLAKLNKRAGHMKHNKGVPTLNSKAVEHAKSLINDGKIDDGAWSFDASDEKALLGEKQDWDQFALWYLGIDKNADAKTVGAYKYPFGKGGKVYTAALRAIRSRASKQSAKAIYDAAGKLLDAANEKLKK